MNFKALTVAVMLVVYLYELFLDIVRYRSARNPIPQNVTDVYDTETYLKWKAYHGEKVRWGIFTKAASFVIDLALILFNAYAAFAASGLFAENAYAQGIAVIILSALANLLLIPFTWHDTMHIEEKYGFNRTGKKTFWGDQLKSFLIGLGLMCGISCLVTWAHGAMGDWLILALAVILTLFILFFTKLLEKNGYKVRAIQVMDASRRSTKSNAYFTGFGKMKTIVLYDTLVAAMTTEEILAVFAHEMGHGLHRDTLKNHILTFFQMLVLAVLAWATLRHPEIFRDFGFAGVNYGFAVILILSVEFALISPLFGLIISWFSRRAEYRADAQAVKEGYGDALISGLKKLARENFSDLAPSPILVLLEYSHPTLSQRISAIEALLGKTR